MFFSFRNRHPWWQLSKFPQNIETASGRTLVRCHANIYKLFGGLDSGMPPRRWLLWIKTAKLRVAAPFNLPMSRRMFTAFTNHAFVNILQMSFFAPFRNDLTKMAQLKYPKPYSTVEFRFRFGEAGWWGAASYQTKKGFDIHIWQSISNCCLKQQNLRCGTIRCDISSAYISRPLEFCSWMIFCNIQCKVHHFQVGGFDAEEHAAFFKLQTCYDGRCYDVHVWCDEMNSAGIGKVSKQFCVGLYYKTDVSFSRLW